MLLENTESKEHLLFCGDKRTVPKNHPQEPPPRTVPQNSKEPSPQEPSPRTAAKNRPPKTHKILQKYYKVLILTKTVPKIAFNVE